MKVWLFPQTRSFQCSYVILPRNYWGNSLRHYVVLTPQYKHVCIYCETHCVSNITLKSWTQQFKNWVVDSTVLWFWVWFQPESDNIFQNNLRLLNTFSYSIGNIVLPDRWSEEWGKLRMDENKWLDLSRPPEKFLCFPECRYRHFDTNEVIEAD
jgi:hypothetical protein